VGGKNPVQKVEPIDNLVIFLLLLSMNKDSDAGIKMSSKPEPGKHDERVSQKIRSIP